MVELSWIEKILSIVTIICGVFFKRMRVLLGKYRRRLIQRFAT